MDMGIEAAGGDNTALAGDRLGTRADHDVDARLDIGIAGLADRGNATIAQRDIGFVNARIIQNQRIGDHRISGAGGALTLYDLSQAEVLRGPQGTLFGRNATGGAINLIPNKPTEELIVKLPIELPNSLKFPCKILFGIDNSIPIFEVKLLAPLLIGDGSLLYPLAIGSNIMSSKAILNLKIALLGPSKHSSVDFALAVIRRTAKKTGIIKLIFFKFCIMAIYIFLPYILYKI